MTPDGTSQIKLEYDNRLRVNHSEVTLAGSTTNYLMKADYSYFADSRVAAKDDTLDNKWERSMKYDFAGRLKFNQFGMGQASDPTVGYKRVYEQTITYDAFSQITSRNTVHWDDANGFAATYTNGRKNPMTNEGLTFDASGNIVHSQPDTNDPHTFQDTTFDAAGRQIVFNSKTKGRQGGWLNYVSEMREEQVFDGDGRPVKEQQGWRSFHISNPPSGSLSTVVKLYQVWSSVLGQSMTTLMPDGTKFETTVFAGGAVIAKNSTAGVGWRTADPVTGTVGHVSSATTTGTEEYEPLGQRLHSQDPVDYNPPTGEGMLNNADFPEWMCEGQNAAWLYGEFFRWPDQCQKRYLQDLDKPLKDLFGWGGKKESPANVSILTRRNIPRGPHDTGPDNGWTTAANSMRSAALTSSSKDDDDTNCLPGRPCLPDEEEVNVPIPLIDMSDTGWIAADVSENVRNFRTAVNAVEEIFAEKDGDNSCANLYGGMGLVALKGISDYVNRAGDRAFRPIPANAKTGIRMTLNPTYTTSQLDMTIPDELGGPSYGAISPTMVNINTNGAFVMGVSPIPSQKLPSFGYPAGTLESRIVQLLHEIGHLVVTYKGPRRPFTVNGSTVFGNSIRLLFPPDGKEGQETESSNNTTKVLNACRTQIDALVKKMKR